MQVVIVDSRITEEMLKPATVGSVAIDLRACITKPLHLHSRMEAMVPTGLRVAIPEGYTGLILPRSGLGSKGLILGNLTGVIDQDFRGEMQMPLLNRLDEGKPFIINPLDRVAQFVLVKTSDLHTIEIVSELDDTARGTNGFNSTGKT